MDTLVRMLKKELKEVERIGLTPANLDLTFKIVDIIKDIYEIEEKELEMEDEDKMRRFFEEKYPLPSKLRNFTYKEEPKHYRGNDMYLKKHLEKITEAAEEYDMGKETYKHGGHEQHMHDGLDKLMYALCEFIEGIMDYAETPAAKELVKTHIHKIKSL